MSDAALEPSTVGLPALRELRALRRRKRIAGIEWFEAAYKVYVTGIAGGVLTLFLASAIGDHRLSDTGLADAARRGPAIIGLVAAVVLASGLRSGSRGGPLALEPAEVRHVLLSPLDRRRVLLAGTLKQLRHNAFLGLVVGVIAGQLAYRRFGSPAAGWMAAGGAVGALVALLHQGAALTACGLRVKRWLATLLGAGVITWAAFDVAHRATAPTTTFGSLAFWPRRVRMADLGAVAIVAVLVVVGIALLGRLSLEQAERRTGLVGQIRFAVTVQDLRTVVVLRRQLALERSRSRPWIKVPGSGKHVMWRRGWHGILRFPATRLLRLVLLGVAAGLAQYGAYRGTTPLVLVSGLALYLAGLDVIEPLAQQIDQSDRSASFPVENGRLQLLHLPAPAVASAIVGLIGAAAAVAAARTGQSIALAAECFLPAAWAGAAGAIVSVGMGAPEQSPSAVGAVVPPEMLGMKIAVRAAWPLVIAMTGGLPILGARSAIAKHKEPVVFGLQASIGVLLLVAGVAAWVRFREPAHAWWRSFLEEGQTAAKERQRARQGTS